MFTRLRVLELASVLAGPSVGQFFAELGAEVIKIENPHTGGDVTRTWKGADEKTDDRSAYFSCCNWGKKSVLLDIGTPEGQSAVTKIASTSDVVIASYKPGDAERLRVDYETFRKVQPAIIYGMISGYGADDNRVGYDAVIQAESGFMDLNGEPSSSPTKMPVALIDVMAAHQLKEALLLALLRKEQTGEGGKVEVSLLETALASLANQATNWLVGGKVPSRQGSAHPNIAPYGDSFVTRDGKRLLLAVGNDRQFAELLMVLGLDPSHPQWIKFRTNPQRVQNRESLKVLLNNAIGQTKSAELIGTLHLHKIPAGIIKDVRDALQVPAATYLTLAGGGLLGLRTFVARGFTQSPLSPPPHLGEHTAEVLSHLS